MPTLYNVSQINATGTLPIGGNYLVLANFDNSADNSAELTMWTVLPGNVRPCDYILNFGLLPSNGWTASNTNMAHSYWKLA